MVESCNFLANKIIEYYYPVDIPLRRLLCKHSIQVRDKALKLLENPHCTALSIDVGVVVCGALCHDIGIVRCHAPDIMCAGEKPYIAHGVIGAQMLREYGAAHQVDLEKYARICERHTGSGLTAADVRIQSLPIPERDYLPETLEEKLICLADKFFSKSGDMAEKSPERVRRSLAKFGLESAVRFDEMCHTFGI